MIEIFHSACKGRGLRAKNGISSGSSVLSSYPVAYVLSKSQKGIRCDHCLKRKEKLLRCSGCKFMKYCDKFCQKCAWPEHKDECSSLQRVSPKIPPDFVLLLRKVVWHLENASNEKNPEDLISIIDLESNYDRLSEQQKEVLGGFLVIFHSFWGKSSLPVQIPNVKALLELCAKIKNNSFAISDEELANDIGTGLYLRCSLLNHSCTPNCVAMFDGTLLHIRALENIKCGDELTISYVDLFAPSGDRRDELFAVYGFRCNCDLCGTKRHDSAMLQDFDGEMTPSKRQSAKDFLHDLNRLRDQSSHSDVLRLCDGYVQRKFLPLENVYMAKVLDLAMDAGIALGKFESALRFGSLALPAYSKYLHERHPMTGLQLMKLAKIMFHLTKDRVALEMMTKAWEVLRVTHGEESIVTKELRQMIDQCQAEVELADRK